MCAVAKGGNIDGAVVAANTHAFQSATKLVIFNVGVVCGQHPRVDDMDTSVVEKQKVAGGQAEDSEGELAVDEIVRRETSNMIPGASRSARRDS